MASKSIGKNCMLHSKHVQFVRASVLDEPVRTRLTPNDAHFQ